MAIALSGILFHIGIYGLARRPVFRRDLWLGFVLTTIVINNAYTFRRFTLTVIDSGHWLGVLLIIGGILGWLGH